MLECTISCRLRRGFGKSMPLGNVPTNSPSTPAEENRSTTATLCRGSGSTKLGETATQPRPRGTAGRTRCHVGGCRETAAEQPRPLGEQRARVFTAFCYLGPLPSYEQPLRPTPLNHDLESVAAVCCSKPSLDYICAAFVSTCVVVIFQGNALAAAGDILFLQLLVQ